MQQSTTQKMQKSNKGQAPTDKQEKRKDKAKPWKRDDKRERFAMM